MIVVVDASTVVGAALRSDGIPRRALVEASRNHALAMSGAVLEEIDEVLRRPKFRRSIPPQMVDEILALLVMASRWCFPTERVQDCRDVGDDIYLELALAARADVIVSSDADLLSMNPWRGVAIVNARSFVEGLRIES